MLLRTPPFADDIAANVVVRACRYSIYYVHVRALSPICMRETCHTHSIHNLYTNIASLLHTHLCPRSSTERKRIPSVMARLLLNSNSDAQVY